jgi:hypothetical protein
MLPHDGLVDPGLRSTRIVVLGVCAVVIAILWIVRGAAQDAFELIATLIASVTAIVAIASPRLFPVRTIVLDDVLKQAAHALTEVLIAQWRVEAQVRGSAPGALAVHFSPLADPALVLGPGQGTRRPSRAREHTVDEIAVMLAAPGSPRRLVVLGGLGAGKSAFVLRAALLLLQARSDAAAASTVPVPVVFGAGSWDPAKPLATWVAERLAEQYRALGVSAPMLDGMARTVASALVEAKRVLPILDGLDEMSPDNRAVAWRALSSAAQQGWPVVVTCRSDEYRDLLAAPDGEPLESTLVIELAPVAPADARDYLSRATAPAANRWDPLLKHLQSQRGSALADVLSTPLMLWLARTVYRRADTDPGELIAMAAEPRRVREHLLDGLIPAAYAGPSARARYREQSGPQLERTRRALSVLARHTQAPGNADIAWWRLHELVPARFIRVTTGLATGSVLGAAVGIAVAAKYGPTAGLAAALADAFLAAALCAVTIMIPKEVPRRLTFRFSPRAVGYKPLGGLTAGLAVGLTFGLACAHGGGVLAGLIVFLVVTPISAVAVGKVFGPLAGTTGGTSAGLAFGPAGALVEHRSPGVLPGLVTGTVFTLMGWLWTALYEPAPKPQAVSPDSLYRSDRTGSLVVGATSGLAYGVAFAFSLGPWIGVLATVVLGFAVTLTVSSWGQFAIAVLWRPLGRGSQLDVMGLLREAHARGVLHQNGMYYQFRHDLLAEHLAKSSTLMSRR